MLSIKNNWSKAQEKHGAYVRARIKGAILRHTSRAEVATQLGDFLDSVPVKHAGLKALLAAIPAYFAILDQLGSPSDVKEFRRQAGMENGTAAKPTPGSAVANYVNRVAKLDGKALKKLINAFDKYRNACATPKLQAAFTRHVTEDLTNCVSLPPAEYRAKRFVPYKKNFEVMIAMDTHTAEFLEKIGTEMGVMEYVELTKTIAVYQDYCDKVTDQAEIGCFKKNVVAVFDYDAFTAKKSDPDGWDAYDLCDASVTRTCPYCNQAYAFTIARDDGKGFRPTLDHYLAQADYPHLAISLNNLIPSCYTCNSNLKHEIDFAKVEHLHPLYDDEHIGFRLTMPDCWNPANGTRQESADFLELITNFDCVKDLATLTVECTPDTPKAEQSAKTFLIEKRYASNLQEALSFVALHIRSLETVIQELGGDLDGLTERQILRFDSHNHRESLLGKLYLDLHGQFKR
jgi:hypothetical protein